MIEEEQEIGQEERNAKLDNIGAVLALKRKEAVDFRRNSGIEEIWDEDQDAYDGIDDENRQSQYEKPSSSSGSLRGNRQTNDRKSTVFVNITAPYVDMASARVADMLLPNDDRPFALDATPIPEIEEFEQDDSIQTFPDGSQAPAKDVVKMIKEKANEIAERSELRIWDWLVESEWHSEVRQVLEDAARIGSGLLRGPFPAKSKVKQVLQGEDGTVEIKIEYETKPKIARGDVRNLFPDPACGNNIHNGSYVWYRDFFSAKQLKELKEDETYLSDQIDMALKEGPGGNSDKNDEDKKSMFEVWYYHGIVSPEDMTASGCECDEDTPAIITMVNNRVIKAAVEVLDSGEFPYDVIPWQRKGDSWTGTGVARQVRTPQLMVNAGTRVMLNNAGLSSMPIWFMKRDGISPADGTSDFTLYPGKGFFVDDDVQMRSVADAVHFLDVPNLQDRFMAIIKYALDLAERLTNMPLMMQGQQGSATETVGGMQILQQNSSAVLRRIAKLFDDNITTPKIKKFYEYLLLYGEDPDEKGDNVIVARGSTALFERDAQNQSILQMAAIVKDPAFGVNPEKWFEEALRAQRIDPARFKYTDEEKQKMAEAAANKPQTDPRIEGQLKVAEIRSSGDMQKAQLTQQSDMAELKLKAEIAQAGIIADREESKLKREHELLMKKMDYRMAEMEYLSKGKIDLTKKTMELSTQERLSTQAMAKDAPKSTPEVSTPPTEPTPRADVGRSYEQ